MPKNLGQLSLPPGYECSLRLLGALGLVRSMHAAVCPLHGVHIDLHAPAVLRMEAVLDKPAFDFKLVHSGASAKRLRTTTRLNTAPTGTGQLVGPPLSASSPPCSQSMVELVGGHAGNRQACGLVKAFQTIVAHHETAPILAVQGD
jgi:hypothetical protein